MVSALFWCSGFHDQFYSAFQCRYPFQRHDTGGGALDEYPHLARHERRLSTTAFLSFSFETPFFLIEFALHLLPFFFFFHAARLLDKLGVGTRECRVRSLLFPLCPTAIIIMMAWFRGAELRGLSRTSGSSASRSGPCLVRVIKTPRQLSFEDWRGYGGVSTAFTSFGREKLRPLGENLALSLLLCVFGIISLYFGLGVFFFSLLYIFTGNLGTRGYTIYPQCICIGEAKCRFWEWIGSFYFGYPGVFLLFPTSFLVQHIGWGGTVQLGDPA